MTGLVSSATVQYGRVTDLRALGVESGSVSIGGISPSALRCTVGTEPGASRNDISPLSCGDAQPVAGSGSPVGRPCDVRSPSHAGQAEHMTQLSRSHGFDARR